MTMRTTMKMIATMMIGKAMVEDRQLSAGWTLGQLESLRSSHAATSPTLGNALHCTLQQPLCNLCNSLCLTCAKSRATVAPCAVCSMLCNVHSVVYCVVPCAMCNLWYVAPPMRAFLPDTLLLTAPITNSPSPNHHLQNHCNHHKTNHHRSMIPHHCIELH